MNKNGFGQKLSQFEFLALQKGKHHGFNAAYKLYADHVYSLAMYIVKNKQTALDVMQTVFEVLLSKSSVLNNVETLGAWLKQCTINACMNFFRKNNKDFLPLEQCSELENNLIEERNTSDCLEKYSQTSTLLNKLSLLQRSIVYFYSIDGLKHREIASTLGINEAYSRKVYSRALKQLRSLLSKSGYNHD